MILPETERSNSPKVDLVQKGSRDIDADGKKLAAVTAVCYCISAVPQAACAIRKASP